MTIECYIDQCKHHSCNSGDHRDEGPFCYEKECHWEPLCPSPYPAEELERDNTYNQGERTNEYLRIEPTLK